MNDTYELKYEKLGWLTAILQTWEIHKTKPFTSSEGVVDYDAEYVLELARKISLLRRQLM